MLHHRPPSLIDENFIRTKNIRINVRKGNDTHAKILELITLQSEISLSEIADQLGVSYKTAHRSMAELKKKGVVVRVGGRKNVNYLPFTKKWILGG